MTAPRFEATINLGHIAQILALVIAGAIAWGVHISTLNQLATQRSEDRQRLESHDTKIQMLERTTDVFKTDLNYIRLSVDEIKHDVKNQSR